jgi:exopolysaccharide biosynthesis WecB/TagA/CpsF family protein
MGFKKVRIFGINYGVVDYDSASTIIVKAAKERQSFGVSALAVHGLMESYFNPLLKEKIEKIHLIVPDGQPVKWVMNKFHNLNLKDRVYGPKLVLEVLKKADLDSLSVYLYGSKLETLDKLSSFIYINYPNVSIVGKHADRFREATEKEDKEDINKIIASNAHIVLVGRGCPRQEIWVSDHIEKINAAMLAVGAAFDFHAGILPQAPRWMQNNSLEWFFRLIKEPKRLWRRYLLTNSQFIYLVIKHKIGIKV